jgi:chromosome segregation ATPase
MMPDDDPRDELIFVLKQENQRLRNQITYLQEELASVEDEMAVRIERLNQKIESLEQQLGDALHMALGGNK